MPSRSMTSMRSFMSIVPKAAPLQIGGPRAPSGSRALLSGFTSPLMALLAAGARASSTCLPIPPSVPS